MLLVLMFLRWRVDKTSFFAAAREMPHMNVMSADIKQKDYDQAI